MVWRIIRISAEDAYHNMSIDHAVSESVKSGEAPPTIRFYTWKPSAVSIGCFQSMESEVNTETCDAFGINYVRRITGGGAVYHDTEGEITYSIIGPVSAFPNGIRESYSAICQCVIAGLGELGIDSSFAPINDIIVAGKKISGNAQTRRNGVLLQHGTVLYRLDVKRMFEVLRVSKEKISDKMIKSVEDRVTCITNYCDADMRTAYEALVKGFSQGRDCEFGALYETEERRADELADSIYSTDKWNFSR